jgi:hypothetical protein
MLALLQAMVRSCASSKRTAPLARSIFSEGGTLQLVLDFLGPGYALYVRSVCKEWKQKYNAVADQPRGAMNNEDGSYPHAHTCHCTSLAAIWGSASTLKLAQQAGCSKASPAHLNTSAMQHKAGLLLSSTELATARDDLGLDFTKNVAEGAAAAGSLPKLQQLFREHGCPLISRKGGNAICEIAARTGNIEMLQWLQGEGKRKFSAATALAAAEAGHSAVVRFLVDAKCPWSPAATAVARHGDLELLKWMVEQHWRRCKWSPDTISGSAARSGSLDVLQYVINQHASIGQHTLNGAVLSDTPELVQFLLQQYGLQLNAGLLHAAAESGLLNMVQYLVLQQCPGGSMCLRAAAAAGHLEVLKCLRAAGHVWLSSTSVCDAALRRGHAAVALYALNNWDVEVDAVGWHQQASLFYMREWLCLAGRAGMLEVAQKLREVNTAWPVALRYKGKPWVSEMVQWARAAGCTAPV